MLQNVYLKSNEISFEVKPLQNIPALEIREKNGKINLKGKIQMMIFNNKLRAQIRLKDTVKLRKKRLLVFR